jgi:hypothetical protein
MNDMARNPNIETLILCWVLDTADKFHVRIV